MRKSLTAIVSACAFWTASHEVVGAAEPSGHAIQYDLTIAGVSIGDASIAMLQEAAQSYDIALNVKFRFLFWSGQANAEATGAVTDAAPAPSHYEATFQGMSEPVVIKTVFDGTGPTDWSITPPPEKKYLEGRIEISEADLVGALDPLSALFIRAETPESACDRTLPIFTGGTRLDLVLSPGAETEPGVFACDVKYVPVSGHRKDSESVARMVKSGPSLLIFEAAPGLWAPHRVGMPTSVGTLAITRAAPQDAD